MTTKEKILEEIKDINYAYNDCSKYDTIKNLLEEMEERNKGEWINEGFYGEGHSQCAIRCSNPLCNFHYIGYVNDYNFCPNCGADMRGEQNG